MALWEESCSMYLKILCCFKYFWNQCVLLMFCTGFLENAHCIYSFIGIHINTNMRFLYCRRVIIVLRTFILAMCIFPYRNFFRGLQVVHKFYRKYTGLNKTDRKHYCLRMWITSRYFLIDACIFQLKCICVLR